MKDAEVVRTSWALLKLSEEAKDAHVPLSQIGEFFIECADVCPPGSHEAVLVRELVDVLRKAWDRRRRNRSFLALKQAKLVRAPYVHTVSVRLVADLLYSARNAPSPWQDVLAINDVVGSGNNSQVFACTVRSVKVPPAPVAPRKSENSSEGEPIAAGETRHVDIISVTDYGEEHSSLPSLRSLDSASMEAPANGAGEVEIQSAVELQATADLDEAGNTTKMVLKPFVSLSEARFTARYLPGTRALPSMLPDAFAHLLLPHLEKSVPFVMHSLPTLRRMYKDVAAQLVEIHRHGVVFRDVSLNNILFNHDSNKFFLSDFGFAVAQDNVTWPLAGTPVTLDSEAFLCPFTVASDFWALNLTTLSVLVPRLHVSDLYYCLGKAFQALGDSEIESAVMRCLFPWSAVQAAATPLAADESSQEITRIVGNSPSGSAVLDRRILGFLQQHDNNTLKVFLEVMHSTVQPLLEETKTAFGEVRSAQQRDYVQVVYTHFADKIHQRNFFVLSCICFRHAFLREIAGRLEQVLFSQCRLPEEEDFPELQSFLRKLFCRIQHACNSRLQRHSSWTVSASKDDETGPASVRCDHVSTRSALSTLSTTAASCLGSHSMHVTDT